MELLNFTGKVEPLIVRACHVHLQCSKILWSFGFSFQFSMELPSLRSTFLWIFEFCVPIFYRTSSIRSKTLWNFSLLIPDFHGTSNFSFRISMELQVSRSSFLWNFRISSHSENVRAACIHKFQYSMELPVLGSSLPKNFSLFVPKFY